MIAIIAEKPSLARNIVAGIGEMKKKGYVDNRIIGELSQKYGSKLKYDAGGKDKALTSEKAYKELLKSVNADEKAAREQGDKKPKEKNKPEDAKPQSEALKENNVQTTPSINTPKIDNDNETTKTGTTSKSGTASETTTKEEKQEDDTANKPENTKSNKQNSGVKPETSSTKVDQSKVTAKPETSNNSGLTQLNNPNIVKQKDGKIREYIGVEQTTGDTLYGWIEYSEKDLENHNQMKDYAQQHEKMAQENRDKANDEIWEQCQNDGELKNKLNVNSKEDLAKMSSQDLNNALGGSNKHLQDAIHHEKQEKECEDMAWFSKNSFNFTADRGKMTKEGEQPIPNVNIKKCAQEEKDKYKQRKNSQQKTEADKKTEVKPTNTEGGTTSKTTNAKDETDGNNNPL